MTTWQALTSTWSWSPAGVILCAVLLAAYVARLQTRPPRAAGYFIAGLCVLLLSLCSPLALLGHHYLFSAHMVQHLLFVLVVPQLLLLGIPSALARRVLNRPAGAALEHFFGRPLVGWIAGAGAMWIWHYPALYNAALQSHTVHLIEHLSLLLLGVLFWWPVVAPVEEKRLAPLLAVAYLFTACLSCTVLGIVLTFSPLGLYPAYVNPPDSLGILPLIREGWGLSPAADQQLGGLIMWIPACLVYISSIMGVLARWYRTPDPEVLAAPPLGVAPVSPALSRTLQRSHGG
jgi:cytochrome c oxidase assembly factor CtaG